MGTEAGENIASTHNTAVGTSALKWASSGASNTAVGSKALTGASGRAITGGYNTAVGMYAGANVEADCGNQFI